MEASQPLYKPERLVAYTDGIFSIALTLLVIDIHLPEVIDNGLLNAIANSWPSFLSFAISFMIITVVWFNHHEMFHNIKQINFSIIFYNTLLMLNIILIPYVSSLLGRSFILEGYDSKMACMIYGLWISFGGIPFNLLWNNATKNNQIINETVDPTIVKTLSKHYSKGPVLYFISALFSIINIWISISLYIVLILIYFIPGSKLVKQKRNLKRKDS